MLTVGYLVSQDTSSIFSYSSEGPVATIDPVSTGGLEWKRFLDAYNEFCIEHGGIPLFNQTPGLTNAQVRRAFGDRLEQFEAVRNRLDPGRRFLNTFFRQLFAVDVEG